MAELRIHDAGLNLHVDLPELRIHDAGIDIIESTQDRELRIHSAGVTFGVPPTGPGGWWVYVNGQWVKHRAWIWFGGQWV